MAKPPPTRMSVKSLKSFAYRGGTKVWSNRYFFTGTPPANSTQWLTLYNAIQALEKACFGSSISLTGGVGYLAGSDVPVWSGGSTVSGTLVPGGNDRLMPGDCARITKYSTDQRTSKNHPIYLFKYYHGVYQNSADPADTPSGVQNTPFLSLGSNLISGVSDGVNTHNICGPFGAVGLVRSLSPLITHRDFPA